MLRLPASVQGAHGSDGLPIAVQPPPLLESAPFGHITQPPRELAAEDPRKTKEKSLDFLGFLWSNLDFSIGYSGNKRKNPPRAKLAYQVACNRFCTQ
jgi:hypothetical protein